MKLSSVFIGNIKSLYGEAGSAWLDKLPQQIKLLSSQWELQNILPLTNLSYNFVASVDRSLDSGILKIAPPEACLLTEVAWLKAHEKIAPKLFQTDTEKNAFLMEKLEPGISLKSHVALDDEKATQIIAQVISDLRSATPIQQIHVPHISEHIASLDYLSKHLPKYTLDKAKSLFSSLCDNRNQDIVLHGDLHHDNILQAGTSWKVIDPHGYQGHPCAEVGVMIFNPIDNFPKDLSIENIIENRVAVLSDGLPYDPQLIRAWAYCLCLRSAAWDVEGFGHPNDQTLKVALYLQSVV